MYSIRKEHGQIKYGVYEFVFDTADDFTQFLSQKMRNDIMPGSTAFIISTSKTYMLNNKSEWTAITSSASSSSDGSDDESSINVNVNGGDI